MKKLDIAKNVVTFIVGAGTSQIAHGIIQNNVTPEKTTDKVAVKVASVVIGSMAADATSEYTGAKIDKMAYWYNETFVKKDA